MYELNSAFSVDRTNFEEDSDQVRQVFGDGGATDVLRCEVLSGVGAGLVVSSARFASMDVVANFLRTGSSTAVDPGDDHNDIRGRFTLVNRVLNRVVGDAGVRGGPCLMVTQASTATPLSVDESDTLQEIFMSNGLTGTTTVLAFDGDSTGDYYAAFFGDTFDQITEAVDATQADDRFRSIVDGVGMKPVTRLLLDIT